MPRTGRYTNAAHRATLRRYRAQQRRKYNRRGYAMKSLRNRPLAKYIRQVMRREEETKYVANQYDSALTALANTWNPTGSLAAATDWYPALPSLGEGTGDYQRIGSKIKPVKATVSMKIGFASDISGAHSLYCVIYYGTTKAIKSYNVSVPPGSAQQILDVGDGTNTTWNGDRFRLNYPVDRKLFNLKRIVFRLTKTDGIQNVDTITPTPVGGNYSTANGLQCKNITLTFRPPKTLSYNDNTDTWPSNYAPIYGIGFCHADGSALTNADTTLLDVSTHCHLWFKDA